MDDPLGYDAACEMTEKFRKRKENLEAILEGKAYDLLTPKMIKTLEYEIVRLNTKMIKQMHLRRKYGHAVGTCGGPDECDICELRGKLYRESSINTNYASSGYRSPYARLKSFIPDGLGLLGNRYRPRSGSF